jgi:hypothetical protein
MSRTWLITGSSRGLGHELPPKQSAADPSDGPALKVWGDLPGVRTM